MLGDFVAGYSSQVIQLGTSRGIERQARTIMNAVKTTSLLTTRSRVRVPPLTPMHIKVCIGVSVAQMDRAGCLTIFVIINLIRNSNVDKNYQQPNWGSP